ncbi:MAG: hypothetical protein K2J65_04765 [Duncaniella sp.]|nr:hypothetical protein [Duncaniella sp.]
MFRFVKVLMFIIMVAAVSAPDAIAEEETTVDLTPKIHGVLRSRWEMETENGASRFQVRNARVTLDGMIAPSIDYFIQTDLCNAGKMQILDAWGRIGLSRQLKFQAGQFRMPFGTDCFRAPANYLFANRSFIGKTMCNVRAVGVKLAYTPFSLGVSDLTIEAGAFNPTSINDHDRWVKTMAYAGKAVYRLRNVKLAAGVQSLEPDSVRMNLLGGSVTWSAGRWLVEGEYMNKHYTHGRHKPAHAYNFYADYRMPVKVGVFNQASFQGRFDGMTAHSTGTRNADGMLATNQPARNRLTIGGTLSYIYKSVHCDVRLDYEKYFYHHGVAAPEGDGDKVCAEFVIRF